MAMRRGEIRRLGREISVNCALSQTAITDKIDAGWIFHESNYVDAVALQPSVVKVREQYIA